MRSLLLVALLFIATPVAAQPNYQAQVQQLAAQYPQAFACAHSGQSCQDDFAYIVAIELHKIDPRVGHNRRRGDGPFSWDALAILDPSGTTTDINGQRSFVIDYIASAGAPNARVQWISVGGVSGWTDPKTLPDPRGASSPAPPAGSGDHALLAALDRLSTIMQAQVDAQHYSNQRLAALEEIMGTAPLPETQLGAQLDALREALQDIRRRLDGRIKIGL
jgi:hypothetical protein